MNHEFTSEMSEIHNVWHHIWIRNKKRI